MICWVNIAAKHTNGTSCAPLSTQTLIILQHFRLYLLISITLFCIMKIPPGTILKSTPLTNDANFEQAIIFIAEHNEKGAMGFVINKKMARALNELEEFKESIAFPLYEGGPMDKEHLYFIHRRSDLIEGGLLIANAIYLGGNFKQAVAQLNSKTINATDIKIFIGYCGWDYNQLEEEAAEGSWIIADAAEQSIFNYLQ
jgi:putative transcriptional regulator